ncbi:MAG TPA: hypothetical protein VFD38_07155 [Myxococcaceae bacterium]|nr:hypothetical protein [Myxococcaceae bacterium]
MRIGRRWKERGETLVPATLAAVSLVLDLAEGGESILHAAAVAVVALAAALSGAAAVVSLGRFGPSRLGRRFALWRACGLLAAAGCLALEVVQRFGTPRLPADTTLELTVLGAGWALLTGWVWGRRSWGRMAAGLAVPGSDDEVAEREAREAMRWTGQEMRKA